MHSKEILKKPRTFVIFFVVTLIVGSLGAHAQNSVLITSGMGGGASSTARLSAQMLQQQGRVDDIETCGNKGQLFGPGFGGPKTNQGCLRSLKLTPDGNVQLWKTSADPGPMLNVRGGARIEDLLFDGSKIVHADLDDDWGWALRQGSAGKTWLNAPVDQEIVFVMGGSNVKMRIRNQEATIWPALTLHRTLQVDDKLTILSGGADITGNVIASNDLTVGGDATADNYYHTLDRRLKDNIRPLEEGQGIVARLKPVRFKWKEGDKPSMGFVAQEVEDILPEAVITNGDGFKAMDYDMLIAPMVATLQDQQSQIAAQQRKLDFQQEQIRKLVDAVTAELPNSGR